MVGLVVIAAGIFCIVASVKNSNWFFKEDRKSFSMDQMFGRKAARVIAVIGGICAIIVGIMLLLGE